MSPIGRLAAVLSLSLLSAGCATAPDHDDRLLYGALGGATGAAVGSAIGGRGAAVLGGVVGAVAGVAIADRQARDERDEWRTSGYQRRGGYDVEAYEDDVYRTRRYSDYRY